MREINQGDEELGYAVSGKDRKRTPKTENTVKEDKNWVPR